jgi:hypothetical protein
MKTVTCDGEATTAAGAVISREPDCSPQVKVMTVIIISLEPLEEPELR